MQGGVSNKPKKITTYCLRRAQVFLVQRPMRRTHLNKNDSDQCGDLVWAMSLSGKRVYRERKSAWSCSPSTMRGCRALGGGGCKRGAQRAREIVGAARVGRWRFVGRGFDFGGGLGRENFFGAEWEGILVVNNVAVVVDVELMMTC